VLDALAEEVERDKERQMPRPPRRACAGCGKAPPEVEDGITHPFHEHMWARPSCGCWQHAACLAHSAEPKGTASIWLQSEDKAEARFHVKKALRAATGLKCVDCQQPVAVCHLLPL